MMAVPKRGKRYKEIVEKGCSGYFVSNSDYQEWECGDEYEWECDMCPVVIEMKKEKMRRNKNGQSETHN